jgi:hypothetical protein
VKGGHPADVKRALSRSLADANAELIGDPSITVSAGRGCPSQTAKINPRRRGHHVAISAQRMATPSNSLIVRRLVRSSARLVSVRVSHLPIAYSGALSPSNELKSISDVLAPWGALPARPAAHPTPPSRPP